MQRSQIHRVSVADQVASVLRQQILTGELRPGMPLQEAPLATSLGVSRNTMREATRILSLEGLLKRRIHRGVVVCPCGPSADRCLIDRRSCRGLCRHGPGQWPRLRRRLLLLPRRLRRR